MFCDEKYFVYYNNTLQNCDPKILFTIRKYFKNCHRYDKNTPSQRAPSLKTFPAVNSRCYIYLFNVSTDDKGTSKQDINLNPKPI